MIKEFLKFIKTGNVVEFAVAVILAGAVSMVVNGFVNDIAMPIVGQVTGGMDFSQMKVVLSEAVVNAEGKEVKAENAIRYGAWINSLVNLIVVGLVLFLIVRAYNRFKKKEEAAPSGPSQTDLLIEIRDLLRKK
ncbi:MAG TPA: large conductance mechanosensitive channel protein MscL [Saprospiraceae bacterium]|nr:large conductance mechanosensitive channel protein MscL [Saprospiraceae bacterium]